MRVLLTVIGFFTFSVLFGQERPELLVQRSHKELVLCMDISPDNKYMASGDKDGLLKFWELKTGREFKTLDIHTEQVTHVQFLKNGTQLLSSSGRVNDRIVAIHEVPSGKLVWSEKERRDGFTEFAVHETSNRIAYYNSSNLICRDLAGKEIYRIKKRIRYLKQLAFNKTGDKLIAMQRDYTLVLNAADGNIIDTIYTPKGARVFSLAPDGNSIIVGDDKFVYMQYSLKTFKQNGAYTIPNPKEYEVKYYSGDYAQPLPDGRIAICHHGYVLLQNPMEEKTDAYITFEIVGNNVKLKKNVKPHVETYAFSSSGDRLGISFTYGKQFLRLVDVESKKVLHDIMPFHSPIYRLRFNPHNKKMYIAGRGFIKIWESNDFGGVTMMDDYIVDIRSMGFHPQDSFLYVQERGGSKWITRMHDGETKMLHFWVKNRERFSTTCHMAGDFGRIYTDKYARNYPDGDTVCSFGKERAVGNFLSPDERYYVTAHWNRGNLKVRLHDALKCKLLKEYVYPDKGFNVANKNKLQVAFSPDGKYMAFARDEVHIYDLTAPTFEPVMKFDGHHKFGYLERFIGQVMFTKDSKKVLSAGMDRVIRVWNLETKKLEKELRGHVDEVNTLVYHPNGKWILSGGADSRIVYWDAQTMKQVATMILFGETDYIITTPDHYYMATKSALERVAFYYKGNVYPFQQFDLRMNRPDIVMEQLALGNVFERKMLKLAWEKRVRTAGFDPVTMDKPDFHAPEVKVNRRGIPASTKNEYLTLNIQAQDDLYNLSKVQVLVNGVPEKNSAFKITGKNSIRLNTKIELSQGSNIIRVSAFNERGIESLQEEIYVVADKPSYTKPTLWVVNVGVSKYKDEQWDLTFADKDAIELGNLFKTKVKGFKEIKVTPITNGDSKNISICGTIENLKTSVDDKVIITFSGHGLLDDKLDYYLAMHEVDFYNPSKGGLKYDDLQASLGKIKARNKLLFLDACHSGEVDKDEAVPAEGHKSEDKLSAARSGPINPKPQAGLTNAFSYMQALFTNVSAGTGTTVISAAGGYEFAYESKNWRNGLFTFSVMDGLVHDVRDRDDTHADVNKDQWISITELLNYVSNKVYTLSRGKQIPNARAFNRDNDFLLFPLY